MSAESGRPTQPEPDKTPGNREPVGPRGLRRPYPVDDPGIGTPDRPGSEPDYLPEGPAGPAESPPRI